MFVGLLFCIPEQAQDRLEIQNFQPRAAAEIWNWLLLLLVLLLPPSRDPHPMKFRKYQKSINFKKEFLHMFVCTHPNAI